MPSQRPKMMRLKQTVYDTNAFSLKKDDGNILIDEERRRNVLTDKERSRNNSMDLRINLEPSNGPQDQSGTFYWTNLKRFYNYCHLSIS